jgi:hypothetical protein
MRLITRDVALDLAKSQHLISHGFTIVLSTVNVYVPETLEFRLLKADFKSRHLLAFYALDQLILDDLDRLAYQLPTSP